MRNAPRRTDLRRSALLIALLLAQPVASAIQAQPDPYRVEELAPGVFGVIRKVPTTGASDSNVLFIINEHDVIVVDANIYPSSARQVIAEIRRRTKNPVRYVITTHYHSDHFYGNGEYLKAFPGVDFIAHPTARELILTQDLPAFRKNVDTEYPAIIALYEKALATGKKSNGTPVTESDRARIAGDLAMYRYYLNDVKSMQPLPPTMTVGDSLVLHRGERSIVVKWLGRGNTAGDLLVHLPKERIVATGDLVVSPIPFGFESYLGDWPVTLRELKKLNVTRIMPGHGYIMMEWSYVDRLIAMFDSVWGQVRAAVASGKSLEETRKAVDFSQYRSAFAAGDSTLARAFDSQFATPIVEAAYKTLKPSVPADTAPGVATR
jgi:cyclase